MTHVKVVLIGDKQTGKTTWLTRMRRLTGDFPSATSTPENPLSDHDQAFFGTGTRYSPTLGVEVHPLEFTTPRGTVSLNVWDTAGQKRLAGLTDGYYLRAQAALLFVGPDQLRADNLEYEFHRVCPESPVIRVYVPTNRLQIPPGWADDAIILDFTLTQLFQLFQKIMAV